MVDLVFQDTDRVGGDDRNLLEANLWLNGFILATEGTHRKIWSCWVCFCLVLGPEEGPKGHRWFT